jgi:hypothetical protein
MSVSHLNDFVVTTVGKQQTLLSGSDSKFSLPRTFYSYIVFGFFILMNNDKQRN